MASPLWCRYHYGHPDMLDKCAMMAQGGISKATKGLNLSEDVFAGMDANLRGHTVVHREYFQVSCHRPDAIMLPHGVAFAPRALEGFARPWDMRPLLGALVARCRTRWSLR